MSESTVTEAIVRSHLQAFIEQQGVDAIVKEYHDDVRIYTEANIYHGRQEAHGFFEGFLAALPADAIEMFTLRSLQVEGNVAYITWSVGRDIPLGTDTFVVDDGMIVSQTFAMHASTAVSSHGE
ncbi:MAG: nuclear transport factor 2 family protein [Terracoccus sp.]